MSSPLQTAITGLNAPQREAVLTTEGPLLVLAGAGSGKTRVITVRTAYLLSRGVRPQAILGVTFTNKAAAEMKERVAAIAGPPGKEVNLGTFHAFCLQLLREHFPLLGRGDAFGLCDGADQASGLRQVLREQGIANPSSILRSIHSRISLWKNDLVTPEQARARAKDDDDELAADAYAGYEAWLVRSQLMDFDDLLLGGVRLLAENDSLRAMLREQLAYLMVDEYQDTNAAQYALLQQLAEKDGNLCAVGDDDQAIYGWRGARVEKILAFEHDFPGAKIVKLEDNYRSTFQVLDAANKVIKHNPLRHDKTMRAARGHGLPLEAFAAPDDTTEADTVCLQIKEQIAQHKLAYKDFAILFRTSLQPRPFEAQLRTRGIPYVLIGGPSFFDRKEVRDVLAYLRAAHNHKDDVSFLRIVNRPARGIGDASLERVAQAAAEHGVPIARAFERGLGDAPPAVLRAGAALVQTLTEWEAGVKGDALGSAVRELLERVGYKSEVDKNYADERVRAQRWGAVEDLVRFAEDHSRRRKKPSLGHFLQELALTTGDDDETPGERDAVHLMTLHAAKGLEFRHVHLVGFEEGVLPHARAVAEGTVEEERRLAYVGITRARDRLVISYCLERPRGGGRATCHPSRFLFELSGKPPPAGWKACDSTAAVGDGDDAAPGGARATSSKRSAKKTAKRTAKKTAKKTAKNTAKNTAERVAQPGPTNGATTGSKPAAAPTASQAAPERRATKRSPP
jgi:DNA helicase-2/ATP-dependent DNA helicase PcrA